MSDRSVAIVTDSTADLPPDTAAAEGVTVVPLQVSIAGATFHDGELSQAEFFERMNAAPQLPTTSQPSVGDFTEAYERALSNAAEVVSIHISSALSGTIESAHKAAEAFGDRVHVFDSKNLSWGLGWQVVEAARAAAAGTGAAEILEVAHRARWRARMIVGVDKLDNLAKGGRIGSLSAFVGGLLNLKVTFTVGSEGTFVPVARVRGGQAALDRTLEWVRTEMAGRTRAAFSVMHAMSEDRARALATSLEGMFDVSEMHVVETGVVISTHTGTGWGVAFLPEE
jgi:DegV family protein with EDD domain